MKRKLVEEEKGKHLEESIEVFKQADPNFILKQVKCAITKEIAKFVKEEKNLSFGCYMHDRIVKNRVQKPYEAMRG